jgi:hypothetical protein
MPVSVPTPVPPRGTDNKLCQPKVNVWPEIVPVTFVSFETARTTDDGKYVAEIVMHPGFKPI